MGGMWIPAFAGMTGMGRQYGIGKAFTGVLDSGLRRNDGGAAGMMAWAAGMTGRGGANEKPSPSGRGWGEGESLSSAKFPATKPPAPAAARGQVGG